MKQRLESLDALRGFDLFCLVALSDILEEVAEAVDKPWMGKIMENFTHKPWEGISFPCVGIHDYLLHVHGRCGDTLLSQ